MMQPVVVQNSTDEFDDIVQGRAQLVQVYPGDILMRCKNNNKLNPEHHSQYQTGTGNLLYLAKHNPTSLKILVSFKRYQS